MPWPIVILLVVCCGLMCRTMLRKAGIGTRDNKPDCGCGTCASKSNKGQ